MEGAKRHCVMVALREGHLGDVQWLWFEVAVQVHIMWGAWVFGRLCEGLCSLLWNVGYSSVMGLGA